MPWLVALTVLLLIGCTQTRNPATGELQYTSLSPADEARLGQQEHPQVLAQFGGAYADPQLQAYVDRIGARLAAASDTPDQRFTFTILDTDIVNAFALPGGYVYVSRGLIALADDEAELAGVIGHEIAHVTARHTAQRYDRQVQGQLGATAAQIGGLILGGILGGEAGAQLGGQLAGGLGSAGATAYVQGYSREQEFQADELGVRYLSDAGYDPQAMASFLETMNANDRLRSGATDGGVPTWLASHPRTVDRVERAIAAAGEAQASGELGRDAFLDAIDGMVFGDSPQQGYVRGDSFLHPELGIRFTAPPGMTLRNAPEAVTGVSGDGRVMVFDAAQAQGSGGPLAFLQEEWVRGQRLDGLRAVQIDGRPGAVGFGQVSFSNRPAQAMFAVVQAEGARYYRFLFLRQGRLTQNDVAGFEQSLASFGSLSAAEAGGLRPLRIDVVEVGAGDTIESLGARMAVPDRQREWFVLLNDLERRPLEAGQRVKLVVRG